MPTKERKRHSEVLIYKGHYPSKKGGELDWQRSAYYWWWQCLKRNADYIKCCDKGGKGALSKLYADFGDVRGDDFWEWWGYRAVKGERARGELLFKERFSTMYKVLGSKDDWEDDFSDKDNFMVCAVNLRAPRRLQQAQFYKTLLKAIEDSGVARKRGRMNADDLKNSTARYPIYKNFTAEHLEACVRCYDEMIANEKRDKKQPLWQLCLNVHDNEMRLFKEKKTTNVGNNRDDKNFLAVIFSRYRDAAKAMIANTSRGQFPNTTLGNEKPKRKIRRGNWGVDLPK